MGGTTIRLSDIASQAGVSSATVSRVINGTAYVEPVTRRKVENAMRALHYRPNLLARGLATRQSRTIGLMIPHIRSPFFAGLATGVEERAEASGFAVFLCHTRESTECEKRTLEVLASRRVDGIIATPVGQESRHFSEISQSVPVVFAARHFPEVAHQLGGGRQRGRQPARGAAPAPGRAPPHRRYQRAPVSVDRQGSLGGRAPAFRGVPGGTGPALTRQRGGFHRTGRLPTGAGSPATIAAARPRYLPPTT